MAKNRNDETPYERIERIAKIHNVKLAPNLVVDSAEATWTAVLPPTPPSDSDKELAGGGEPVVP